MKNYLATVNGILIAGLLTWFVILALIFTGAYVAVPEQQLNQVAIDSVSYTRK
jgi:hypothetical protein